MQREEPAEVERAILKTIVYQPITHLLNHRRIVGPVGDNQVKLREFPGVEQAVDGV